MAWGLSHISSRELSEWQIYHQLEPWGEERADYRNGMFMALTANIHRDPDKRREPFVPEDFLPKVQEPKPEDEPEPEIMPWQTQLEIVRMWNAALGGSEIEQ